MCLVLAPACSHVEVNPYFTIWCYYCRFCRTQVFSAIARWKPLGKHGPERINSQRLASLATLLAREDRTKATVLLVQLLVLRVVILTRWLRDSRPVVCCTVYILFSFGCIYWQFLIVLYGRNKFTLLRRCAVVCFWKKIWAHQKTCVTIRVSFFGYGCFLFLPLIKRLPFYLLYLVTAFILFQ